MRDNYPGTSIYKLSYAATSLLTHRRKERKSKIQDNGSIATTNKLNFCNPQWEEWKSKFEAFALITELKTKYPDIQAATLKGNEADNIMKSFDPTVEESKSYDTVLARFDQYFKPKMNIIRLRRIFNRRLQNKHEEYLRALNKFAEDCGFTDE